MAQEHLGSDVNSSAAATTLGVVMTLAVQVGDEIVVWCRAGSNAPNTPTDTIGNTYTLIVDGFALYSLGCWRATSTGAASAGGNTVTVTQSSARLGINVHHLRGMATSPVDQTTAVNDAAAATPAFTTTQAHEIIVAAMGTATQPTPESDYGGANDEGDTTGRLWTCHRVATTILTTETVDWTGATGNCAAATFKEAVGGGNDLSVGHLGEPVIGGSVF